MALLSPVSPTALFTLSSKSNLSKKAQHTCFVKNTYANLFLAKSSNNDGAAAVVVEEKKSEQKEVVQNEAEVKKEEPLDSNGDGVALEVEAGESAFKDPRWGKGTWNLKMFEKNGTTDWDAVIDAEALRRKLLQDNPIPSSNDEPVLFDASIVPWWAWIKRFHLPEAEKLNGRAAMIGFFMAYFVDSLTGAGLVTQTGNFFCKTLLFISVVGVLFIRNNEDIETLKKLFEETTFYDKQWQATWQEDGSSNPSKK